MINSRDELIRIRIRKSIADAGLSRLKVAEKADISYANLTRFLNKTRTGSLGIDVLQKLACALNVPVSYLLGETDQEGSSPIFVDNTPLNDEWDTLIKKIMELPKDKRERLYKIIKVNLENIL